MSTDLYAQTTARIVAALEQGVAPWVRPWSTGIDTLPMNAGSKRAYRGINVVLLALEAQRHGYLRNAWLTYRQASELGGQVRRDEQGAQVVFWRLRNVAAIADTYPATDEHDLPDRVVPLLRSFTVFNVAQIDGLPPELMATPVVTWEPEARAEELLLMSRAVIRHGSPQAYYQPGIDEIHQHRGRGSRQACATTPRRCTSSATGPRILLAANASSESGSAMALMPQRS